MDIKNNIKYLIIAILISIATFFIIDNFLKLKIDSLKQDKLTTITDNTKELVKQLIEDKSYSTLNVALSISEYAASNKLISNNSKELYEGLKTISSKIKKNSNFKNLWLQIIDSNGISRYRSWSDKSGDDISKVRNELNDLIKNPKVTSVISVGIFDMTFKSIVPIYEDGKFMGFIEAITKFNSISRKLHKSGMDLLILVDKKYKSQITKPFTKTFIDDYYVANIDASKELIELTQTNLDKFVNIKNYAIDSGKFIINYELNDFKNEKMANIFIFQNYDRIFLSEIKNLENFLRIIGYLISIIIISILAIVFYFNKAKYTKMLEKEVKERTKELNQLIKRYKQLFEGSKAIKLLVNPENFEIFDANKSALAFYGYSKKEIQNLKITDLCTYSENDIKKTFEQILNEEKNKFNFKHNLSNGETRDVEVYCSAIDVKDKKYIYSIIRDVTEELKIQDEYEKKQKLFYQQAKMASMGSMLENIAHQWRQPLSTITTAASGVKLKKEFDLLDDEFLEESLSVIVKSSNFLSQTIEDFRNFFRHSNEHELFKITDAIDDCFNILKMKLSSNSIQTYLINDSEVEIEGYKNEFVQIFLNLINNSIDVFKSTNCKNRIILIKIERNENNIDILFCDSAEGISDDIIDKVFEPYFTTKHQSQGTGIGLYMTEEIINRHFKGSITVSNNSFTVKSKEYYGANFLISVPITQED